MSKSLIQPRDSKYPDPEKQTKCGILYIADPVQVATFLGSDPVWALVADGDWGEYLEASRLHSTDDNYMSLRSRAFSLVRVTGLPAVMRHVNRYEVPILMYHGFTRREYAGDHFEPLHIDEIAFRKHLEFLSDNYTVISLRELAVAMSSGEFLRPRTAVITIDDGYASVAEIAFPLLTEFGLPATVFVCTDFLGGAPLYHDRVEYAIKNCDQDKIAVSWFSDGAELSLAGGEARWACYSSLMEYLKKAAHADRDSLIDSLEAVAGANLTLTEDADPDYRPMSWGQTLSLSRSPLIEIGNHTKSHAILTNCSTEQMANEIDEADDELEKQIGRRCDLFCYPNGGPRDFSPETRVLLEARNYVCATTTVPGLVNKNSDAAQLNRFFARDNVTELAVSISGSIDAVKSKVTNLKNGLYR